MTLERISEYGNLYQNYNIQNMKTVTPDEVKKQSEQTLQKHSKQSNYSTPTIENDTRSRIADLDNISLTFRKDESFDYIGTYSSLENLDMEKAISDMKKDQVLQQYQYFVGNSQNIIANNADGIVIAK